MITSIVACVATAKPGAQPTIDAAVQRPPQPAPGARFIFQATGISEDISSLSIQDTGESFVVLLYGKGFPDTVKPFKPFENVSVQVWLLRHDSTVQSRRGDPPMKAGIANGGYVQEVMSLAFARSSPADLVGIVVSDNGKLFVREIK